MRRGFTRTVITEKAVMDTNWKFLCAGMSRVVPSLRKGLDVLETLAASQAFACPRHHCGRWSLQSFAPLPTVQASCRPQ